MLMKDATPLTPSSARAELYLQMLTTYNLRSHRTRQYNYKKKRKKEAVKKGPFGGRGVNQHLMTFPPHCGSLNINLLM